MSKIVNNENIKCVDFDLSDIPTRKIKDKEVYCWSKSSNHEIRYKYKDNIGTIKILEYDKDEKIKYLIGNKEYLSYTCNLDTSVSQKVIMHHEIINNEINLLVKHNEGFIDYTDIPQITRKKKIIYSWSNAIGCELRYKYKDSEGVVKINDYYKEGKVEFSLYDKKFTCFTNNIDSGVYRQIKEYHELENRLKDGLNEVINDGNGNYIDLAEIPKSIVGGNLSYSWSNSYGCNIKYKFNELDGVISILSYNSKRDELKIKIANIITSIKINSLIKCKLNIALGIRKKRREQVYKAGDRLVDTKRDLTIIDCFFDKFVSCRVKCNKCGTEDIKTQSSLLRNQGCSYCSTSPKKVKVGVNSIIDTAPQLLDYMDYDTASTNFCNSTKKIYPRCPFCGKLSNRLYAITSLHRNNGFLCECKTMHISKPERILRYIISCIPELFNKVIYEYTPKWEGINNKRYDCYFNWEGRNYLIEMDGEQHKKPTSLFGMGVSQSDIIKNELAKQNGYILERIDCEIVNTETIFNKLNDCFLGQLFDLSIIDLDKLKLQVENTSIIDMCKDYDSGMSLKNIADKYKLSIGTIRKKIKDGEKLGLCTFDPSTYGKKIYCAMINKNYNTSKEASEKSLEDLGKYLTISSILNRCKGTTKNNPEGFQYIMRGDERYGNNNIAKR